jgi:UDP-glucose 4-epimerase
MKPKILITGASGFVGAAFTRRIQDRFDVFAIGRTIPSDISESHFFKIDLTDPEAEMNLTKCLENHRFHSTIHFAATTPHTGLIDQEDFYSVNILGTHRLLQSIIDKTKKFAYISTVDVYGSTGNSIIDETSSPNPNNLYGISKLAAELETKVWGKKHHIPTTIFRLGQVYGPGDPSKKAIPNFCRAVIENKPLILKGNGQDIRQPIYIEDVASAIENWLTIPSREKSSQFLLVGLEHITIRSLAAIISRLHSRKRVEIINKPAEKQETSQYFNNERTIQLLNWKPIVQIIEGIDKTLKSLED